MAVFQNCKNGELQFSRMCPLLTVQQISKCTTFSVYVYYTIIHNCHVGDTKSSFWQHLYWYLLLFLKKLFFFKGTLWSYSLSIYWRCWHLYWTKEDYHLWNNNPCLDKVNFWFILHPFLYPDHHLYKQHTKHPLFRKCTYFLYFCVN